MPEIRFPRVRLEPLDDIVSALPKRKGIQNLLFDETTSSYSASHSLAMLSLTLQRICDACDTPRLRLLS